jgi:hypothetical protein
MLSLCTVGVPYCCHQCNKYWKRFLGSTAVRCLSLRYIRLCQRQQLDTYLGIHEERPIFLSDLNQIWIFWTDVRKSPQYQISRKSVQCDRADTRGQALFAIHKNATNTGHGTMSTSLRVEPSGLNRRLTQLSGIRKVLRLNLCRGGNLKLGHDCFLPHLSS